MAKGKATTNVASSLQQLPSIKVSELNQYYENGEQGGGNRTRDASPETLIMQSYKNNSNTVLGINDIKNSALAMKRSFNNNPMTLSVDFNNGALGLGNSGSGKNFNFKLPAMIAAQNDSLNYKMTRNSSGYIQKKPSVFDKTSEEII
jgi:hypothetical protein